MISSRCRASENSQQFRGIELESRLSRRFHRSTHTREIRVASLRLLANNTTNNTTNNNTNNNTNTTTHGQQEPRGNLCFGLLLRCVGVLGDVLHLAAHRRVDQTREDRVQRRAE